MNLIFKNKPYNWTSHKHSEEHVGYIEFLQEELDKKLWICHRLDKTTSGAICFAEDKETAAKTEILFREKLVNKTYLMITKGTTDKIEATIESHIEEKNGSYTSNQNAAPNSLSRFKKLKEYGAYSLWQVKPLSGKTHQIRLHAKDLGIPILGDSIYGGASYPIICLHSQSIEIDSHSYTARPPEFYDDLSLFDNENLVSLITALDKRTKLFKTLDAHRLSHNEIDGLRIDILGEHIWYQIYNDSITKTIVLEIHKYLEKYFNKQIPYHIQNMIDRGLDPSEQQKEGQSDEESWFLEEHGIKYIIKSNQGNSYGIFLDQRNNRKWMQENSLNKSVLNLFCYSGGFSLNSIKGGAKRSISVDTSKKTLDWLKENLELNQMLPNQNESYCMDARLYLKKAIKHNEKFDIIVCDPPSFARSKNKVFKIDKDYKDLILDCLQALNKDGCLLFFTNYEKWTEKIFLDKIKDLIKDKGMIQDYMTSDWDYEDPNQERILKGIRIKKA